MSTPPVIDTAKHRAAFRRLHESGCFVIPNPWDIGTARYLRSLGFQALATTSSGFAFSRGLPDADWAVPRDAMLAHIAEIVAAAVDLPVNAEIVAQNVRLCMETGIAGLSIEDATGDMAKPLYDLPFAVERIKAARAAIHASGKDVLLTARAECFLVGHPDPLAESIRRLEAYAEAGADVLYAPGLQSLKEIRAVVAAVSPKPVNVLVSGSMDLCVADLAEAGVRRISVGSALARAAWGGFMRSAEIIAREGSFEGFAQSRPFAEINAFFRRDFDERHPKGAGKS